VKKEEERFESDKDKKLRFKF